VKLFFFGGNFNPPHKGHTEIIRQSIIKCDKFIIFPTIFSPLKNKNSNIDPQHILNMLQLIVNDIDPSIQIDRFDLDRIGPTYTIDTIKYLIGKFPKYSISMVIGGDQLLKLNQWKDYDKIINLVKIISFKRDQQNHSNVSDLNISYINNYNYYISSTKIREDMHQGIYNDEHINRAVKNYIIKNQLYIK